MGQKSKYAHAIIYRYKYDPLFRQGLTIVNGHTRAAAGKTSAVDPYKNRLFFTTARFCPYIQVKAIFADRLIRYQKFRCINHKRDWLCLHGAGSECVTSFYPRPWPHRLRGFPSQLAYRWSRKWDTFKRDNAAGCIPHTRYQPTRYPYCISIFTGISSGYK